MGLHVFQVVDVGPGGARAGNSFTSLRRATDAACARAQQLSSRLRDDATAVVVLDEHDRTVHTVAIRRARVA